jgi:hypothetical protein
LYKSNGFINLNNLIFIKVSDEYLHDDVAFIRARPGQYVNSVILASQLWSTPADQAFVGGPVSNSSLHDIVRYANDYDRVVLLQPTSDRLALALITYYPVQGQTIPSNYLAYTIVIMDLLALGGLPIIAGRRWRSDPSLAGFCLALWISVAYAFAVTSFFELGENARFSFELGPLPLIAATLVITNLCRAIRGSALRDYRVHRAPVTASSASLRQEDNGSNDEPI